MPETADVSCLIENGRRLRCLWLTRDDPTHPDAGDLTYSLHLLTSLARAGAHVTVLTVGRTGGKRRTTAGGIEWILLAPTKGQITGNPAFSGLFGPLPNIAARYNTRAFRRELSIQLARAWDAIIVDQIGMGGAWSRVEAYKRRNPAVISVYIAHNCEGDVKRLLARNFRGSHLRKMALYTDALKARRLERRIIRGASLFSTITADDRETFGSPANSLLLSPGYAGPRFPSRQITAATPRRALMFGAAFWLAKQINLSSFLAAADDLFRRNEIELWVVGKVPDHLSADGRYRATRFVGFVDDPTPIFGNARIGIVAEKTGGGFKLKSLDYLFNRLPIAALTGSISGLPLVPGVDYLAFETLEELAQGIIGTIDDLERLNALHEAAYAKCSSGFDWSERGRTLLAAMQRTVGQRAIARGCPLS